MIYYSKSLRSPYRYPQTIDVNEKRFVDITYIPGVWTTATIYKVGDIILPTVFKGVAYKCTITGKTGATEPVWTNVVDAVTVDGATFVGIDYIDMIDNISLTITSSTFTVTDLVTLTLSTSTTKTTQCFINVIPAGVNSFVITNHTIWNNAEERDFSILYRVSEK
jgi:hypothetical protein